MSLAGILSTMRLWSTLYFKMVYYWQNIYHLGECELCFKPSSSAGFLCADCFAQLAKPATPIRLFQRQSAFDFLHCSYLYQPPLSRWIKSFKDRQQLAQLPKLIWLMQQQVPLLNQIDAVVYVPSARSKLLKRGFNPAELLARGLAQHYHWPVLAHGLKKHAAADQRGLNRHQRLLNSRRSLGVGKLDLTGKRILLIEDVLTTGATAYAAALALKQQGAQWVGVWALARTPWQNSTDVF